MFSLLIMRYAFNRWGENDLKKADTAYLTVASILLALLTGLRGKYVGPDTTTYMANFLSMRRIPFFTAISEKTGRFEGGYKFLTRFVGIFTDSTVIFFCICAGSFAVCLWIYINKNSKNKFMSIMLYFTVQGFSFQLSGVRQALAMGFCLISFEYIKQRKFLKFLFWVLIASLFHKSALAIIPMYFFAYFKMDFKNFFLYVIGGVSVVIFRVVLVTILSNVLGYDGYLDDGGFQGGAVFVVLMYIITIIVAYIYKNSLEKEDKNNLLFFNMTFVSFIIYLLRYFINVVERVSFYYQFAFIILLPNVIESIPDKKTRNLVRGCALFLACALLTYRCIRGDTNRIYNYYFFWQR